MARIGAFHSVLFEVSYYKILTFDNYSRKTAANYATHAILNRKEKLEFTGIKAQEISMEILLHQNLGIDVQAELKKLREMVESGTADFLIIGSEVIANSRFVIEEMAESVLHWSGTGTPLVVKCNLKLKEDAQ